jgi:hypothetical protein
LCITVVVLGARPLIDFAAETSREALNLLNEMLNFI